MRIALAVLMAVPWRRTPGGFAGAWRLAPDGIPYKTRCWPVMSILATSASAPSACCGWDWRLGSRSRPPVPLATDPGGRHWQSA